MVVQGTTAGGTAREDPVVRAVRGVMNKLTRRKFENLFQQLTGEGCGISTTHHVQRLTEMLQEKSASQHPFIPMYADLGVRLHNWVQINSPVSDLPGGGFRRMLVDQCQETFQQFLGWTQHSEEDEILRNKMKTKMVGNAKFIGELVGRGLVPSLVLFSCVGELLGHLGAEALETLSAMLMAVGPHYDTKPPWSRRRNQLAEVFTAVEQLCASGTLGFRTRCLLQDVLDARARSWAPQIGKEVPQIQYIEKLVDVPAQRTVEVPQVQKIQRTVQRTVEVPQIQKVQRTVEVPQIQFIEKFVDVPVIKKVEVPQIQKIQRRTVEGPQIQKVQRTVAVPQIQYVERIVDVPVQRTVEVPQIQEIQKHQEVIMIETLERVVDVPVINRWKCPRSRPSRKLWRSRRSRQWRGRSRSHRWRPLRERREWCRSRARPSARTPRRR